MKDGELAVEVLVCGIQNKKRILIVGDYDADGATATVLGMLGLRKFGFDQVDYWVPNRFDYGYGLSPEIALCAIAKNPHIVITVDNGISSVAGAKLIKQAGIELIITDHHLPPSELPQADAILNPNQLGCAFPEKSVSGVGVMFYLLVLLRAKLKLENWFNDQGIEIPNLTDYLDLVALGTV